MLPYSEILSISRMKLTISQLFISFLSVSRARRWERPHSPIILKIIKFLSYLRLQLLSLSCLSSSCKDVPSIQLLHLVSKRSSKPFGFVSPNEFLATMSDLDLSTALVPYPVSQRSPRTRNISCNQENIPPRPLRPLSLPRRSRHHSQPLTLSVSYYYQQSHNFVLRARGGKDPSKISKFYFFGYLFLKAWFSKVSETFLIFVAFQFRSRFIT